MKLRNSSQPIGIGLLVLGLLTAFAPPAGAGEGLEPGEFDPGAWNTLLDRFATENGVNYAAWKEAGTAELDAWLDAAAEYDLTSILGKEPRAAFLANAYDAWAVRQVLEHYPVSSVAEIEGFFDLNSRRIAGEDRTLRDIEGALARTMKHDPNILLALSSGAKGDPVLAPVAFRSKNVIELAREMAGAYLIGPGGLSCDREAKVLHVPAVILRNLETLESYPQGVIGFVSQYLGLADVMAVNNDEYTLEAVDWDPALRDASGPDAK